MLEFLSNENIEKASKEQLLVAIDNYLEEVSLNGGDPLRDIVVIRKISFLLKEVEDAVKSLAINELSNYDKGQTNMLGAFVKKYDTAIKYDYSANDVWNKQKSKLDDETNRLKVIESKLKNLSEPSEYIDEESGEVSVAYPPIRSCTETIKVVID